MIKYVLIGCGRISPNHLLAALNNQLHICALCDLMPVAMQEKGKSFGLSGVNYYTDYREMLAKEEPDLVGIATESGSHAAIASYCLKARIHTIVEKPIALSLEDANDLVELANSNQVILCPCHQNRFNESVMMIRKALESGRFGRLLHGAAHVRWNRDRAYYEQAAWRGTWAHDGGALMNQCIHNIDLLRWMMGDDIEEVFAYTDRLLHPYIGAEDLGVALIKFSNGSYGLIEGTTNIYPANLEETLYIFGSTGTVKAGGKSANIIEEWEFADDLDDANMMKASCSEEPPDIYGYGHTALYRDVIRAITNNTKPFISPEAGRRAIELVLAIYQSAYEGKPVRLPLMSGSTMDYHERFRSP